MTAAHSKHVPEGVNWALADVKRVLAARAGPDPDPNCKERQRSYPRRPHCNTQSCGVCERKNAQYRRYQREEKDEVDSEKSLANPPLVGPASGFFIIKMPRWQHRQRDSQR